MFLSTVKNVVKVKWKLYFWLSYFLSVKALLRRMYGELQEPRTITRTTVRVVRTFSGSARFRRDVLEGTLEEMLEPEEVAERSKVSNSSVSERVRRQADFPGPPDKNSDPKKEDVCESKVEIVTPYWASNSNGKVRAIMNNKEFEQAIHQEICTKSTTSRCSRDCACEQKYKWHRLLAYDPNNDCAGIFMDWFLYPSCCVCRCNKNPFLKQGWNRNQSEAKKSESWAAQPSHPVCCNHHQFHIVENLEPALIYMDPPTYHKLPASQYCAFGTPLK